MYSLFRQTFTTKIYTSMNFLYESLILIVQAVNGVYEVGRVSVEETNGTRAAGTQNQNGRGRSGLSGALGGGRASNGAPGGGDRGCWPVDLRSSIQLLVYPLILLLMVLLWYFTETYEVMAEVYVMMSEYSNHLPIHNVSLKRIRDRMTEAQAIAAVCRRMIQHLCQLVPIPDQRVNPFVDVVVHYDVDQTESFGVHGDTTIEEVVQLVLPGQGDEVVVLDENGIELQLAMRVGINRVIYVYK